MKKIYAEPQMIEADLMEVSMLAQSRGVTGKVGTTKVIDYGGVNTNGSKDPEVKGEAGWYDYE